MIANCNVTITVEHRNSDEPTWSVLGAFTTFSAKGIYTVDLSEIEEIVRFKYEFDPADDAADGIHFLMQAPSRRPY